MPFNMYLIMLPMEKTRSSQFLRLGGGSGNQQSSKRYLRMDRHFLARDGSRHGPTKTKEFPMAVLSLLIQQEFFLVTSVRTIKNEIWQCAFPSQLTM